VVESEREEASTMNISLFLFLSLVDTHVMLSLSRLRRPVSCTHDRLSDSRHVLPYTDFDFIICLAQFTSYSEDALLCFIKTPGTPLPQP